MKYTNNEAYFDVIEEVDAIIDKNGQTVFAEIQGYVSRTCYVKAIVINLFVTLRLIAASNCRVCRILRFLS